MHRPARAFPISAASNSWAIRVRLLCRVYNTGLGKLRCKADVDATLQPMNIINIISTTITIIITTIITTITIISKCHLTFERTSPEKTPTGQEIRVQRRC